MSSNINLKPKKQVELERLHARIAYQASLLASNNINSYDETAEHAGFDAACEKFRNVCAKVSSVIGKQFLGSYEEIEAVQDSLTAELKFELLFVNQLCIHEGSKIGLPPPQWFFKCWGIEQ